MTKYCKLPEKAQYRHTRKHSHGPRVEESCKLDSDLLFVCASARILKVPLQNAIKWNQLLLPTGALLNSFQAFAPASQSPFEAPAF